MSTKVQKTMVQPINLIFRMLQQKQKIQVWLFDRTDMKIEGKLIGFDEFMSLVLDEAEEIHIKKGVKVPVGRILLKGDNITLICAAPSG
ncbi:hypothetical protein EDD86DRAFT_190665 [Gorgonomyces haynaldii]|nr:hypothetical protein EDD86DRAFT_190665 [Gorgonomyces haynaldii]